MVVRSTDVPNVSCHDSFVPNISPNDPESSLLLWASNILLDDFGAFQLGVTTTPKEIP